jgi:hypothetical protein
MTKQEFPRLFHYKREAKAYLTEMQAALGGEWSIELKGANYVVDQVKSAADLKQEKAEINARFYLDYDFWSPESYGSFYREREKVQEQIAAWQERFTKDPFDALSWGIEACQAAADLRALSWAIGAHEQGDDDQTICLSFEGHVSRSSRFNSLSQSSSPMSSLMDRAATIAEAKIASRLRSYIDKKAESLGVLYDL